MGSPLPISVRGSASQASSCATRRTPQPCGSRPGSIPPKQRLIAWCPSSQLSANERAVETAHRPIANRSPTPPMPLCLAVGRGGKGRKDAAQAVWQVAFQECATRHVNLFADATTPMKEFHQIATVKGNLHLDALHRLSDDA